MGELIIEFTLSERSLKIFNNEKIEYNLPYLWVRDNCPCNECRIKETQEKRFILSSVPPDLK
ncbi:gamma-butyrobetaine hydroxylase-like domain-containing protein, partial [Gammaproteobacteria bacterium]|nr:gamma-butyrobetaine hydroxylase-like domain-containing protein [Gammaproteobacteria bacterium]